MVINQSDLYDLMRYAEKAALEAGKALQRFSRKNLQINKKKEAVSLASAVVTEADIASQVIVISTLAPTIEKYDLALLSEEKPDDKLRFSKDYFWCIDPLDGTLPYTEGRDGYAVSIALISKEGNAMIGVVYRPPRDEMWTALKNDGVERNGVAWKTVHTMDSQRTARYLVDRSFLTDPRFEETKKMLHRISLKSGFKEVTIEHVGGAVMQAIDVLQHPPSCYFKLPRSGNSGGSIWDYAATNCIYNEAGMFVSDIYGRPMDLNRIDSTFMNHHGLIYASDPKMVEIIDSLHRHFQ